MKWMIIRQKDERSSDICAAIEEKALREGGLEFPFNIEGKTFNTDTVTDALNTTGQYYTNLFHEHCRSHLVPVSEHSDILNPARGFDQLDELVLTNSAISYNADTQLQSSTIIPENPKEQYFLNKFRAKAKQALNFLVKQPQTYDYMYNL